MTIGIIFTFLMILFDRKAEREFHKCDLQEKKIYSTDHMVITSNLNSERMRPICQTSSALKFVKSRYRRG